MKPNTSVLSSHSSKLGGISSSITNLRTAPLGCLNCLGSALPTTVTMQAAGAEVLLSINLVRNHFFALCNWAIASPLELANWAGMRLQVSLPIVCLSTPASWCTLQAFEPCTLPPLLRGCICLWLSWSLFPHQRWQTAPTSWHLCIQLSG